MKSADWADWIFSGLVGLYPASIKREYGAEMRAVFRLANRAAANRGWFGVAQLLLRELVDLPAVLAEAHWRELQRSWRSWFDGTIWGPAEGSLARPSWRISMESRSISTLSRREALLAALPPALLGLAITFEALTYRWGVTVPLTWRAVLPLLAPVLAGLLLGIVSLIAVFKRLPAWGVSWLGAFLMGLTLFVKVMSEELVDEGTIALSPTAELVLALVILLAGLMVLLLLARRGWQQTGLCTLAAAGVFTLSLLQAVLAAPFVRTDLASLAGPAGLLFAALLYLYVLGSERLRLVVIGTTGLFSAGLVVLVNSAWRGRMIQANQATPLIPLLVLMLLVLSSGPLVGWLIGGRKTA